MIPTGLKARLTLMVALVALVAVTLLTAGFNLLLRTSLRDDQDRVLTARTTAALNGIEIDGAQLAPPEGADAGIPDAGVWIYSGATRVEGPTGSPEATAAADQIGRNETVPGADVEEQDLRLSSAPILAEDGRQIGTVVVSLNVEPYERSANQALVTSVLLAIGMFALIVGLTRLVVNRALKPVAEMTTEAAEWSEHDLDHRFDLGPPKDELTALASTFDSLLDRLAENLRREQLLTAEISHELRTPVAAIAAEAELALHRPRQDEEYRRALGDIHRRSRQLAEIIETLMVAARSQSLLSRETADANAAARRAIEGLDVGEDSAEVALEPAPADPSVQAGLAAASQVIAPLLENACRHGASPITLVVATEDREVEFEIRDSGPGIPEGDLERIFEPGVRGVSAGSESAGAGLGLALARRLARALGGDVVAVPSAAGGILRATLPLARSR